MSEINKYATKGAYTSDASSRSATASNVSQVGETIVYDGIVTIVPYRATNAERGDFLLYDREDNKWVFCKWRTYRANVLNAVKMSNNASVNRYYDPGLAVDYIHLGKCYFATVDSPAAASIWAQAEYDRIVVCDIAEAIQLTWSAYPYGGTATNQTLQIDPGDDAAAIVTKLNTAFATIAQNGSLSYLKAFVCDAKVDEEYVDVAKYKFTVGIRVSSNSTTATATECGTARFQVLKVNDTDCARQEGSDTIITPNKADYKEVETAFFVRMSAHNYQIEDAAACVPGYKSAGAILRNNGVSSYYAGANFAGFKAYYATNGSAEFVADTAEGIMKESVFNGLATATAANQQMLYQKYDGSYDNYIMGQMMKLPVNKGGVRNQWNCAAEQNALLAQAKTYDYNGNEIAAYPAAAAAYAVEKTDAVSGATVGRGFMPDLYGMYTRMSQIQHVGTGTVPGDDLNQAIKQHGSTAYIRTTDYFWLVAQYTATGAFRFTGTYRSIGNGIRKFLSFGVRPAFALEIEG